MTELEDLQIVHMNDNVYGEILREKRVVQNFTQQVVADKAGITLRQYQRFENGERSIRSASFDLACRVIEALGMDVSDFYHDKFIIGEEVYLDKEGLKYVKTDRLINEEV